MMIKVCGLSDNESSRQVASLNGVDCIGFIFYNGSKRYTENTISSKQKNRVGVFVNENATQIIELVKQHQLTHVQLHGNETVEFCANLTINALKMKAFGISKREDFQHVYAYEKSVDYFLFDTKTIEYGGSGQQFDWSILEAYTGNTPFFLSGGIGPESVAAIKQIQHPKLIGIDINSRFEVEPGIKDFNQIQLFVDSIQLERN